MLIPRYWAEARLQETHSGKSLTVRRFGWSLQSQEEAQSVAEARAREAIDKIRAGETLPRRERKQAYGGADGAPIREEIVEEHGTTVITRNSYGARCLNTPNVLFADLDDEVASVSFAASCLLPVVGVITSIAVGYQTGSLLWGAALFVLAVMFGPLVALALTSIKVRLSGGPRAVRQRQIRGWMEKHPEWRLRIYETPAGIRLLATHAVFDPTSPEAVEFLKAMKSDPVYVTMCLNQRCFRARLTAKPWRIGVGAITPRPGVWPVAPDRLAGRRNWVQQYEEKAQNFAACRFVEELGSGSTHRDADAVRRLHDQLSGANSGLPIA